MSVCRGGSAEDHVVPIAQRHFLDDRRGVLGDRKTLASQCGFRGLQCGGFDQAPVGGDRVAFLDQHDVARHYLDSRYAPAFAAANHRGISRGHRAEGGECRLRTPLLHIAHRRVQQDDGEDRDGLVGPRRLALERPEPGRDNRRDEQQDDEHILELREKPPPRRHGFLARKLVTPEPLESRASVLIVQTAPLV